MAVIETSLETMKWNCDHLWPNQMVDKCSIRAMNMLSTVWWLWGFKKMQRNIIYLLCSLKTYWQHWENLGENICMVFSPSAERPLLAVKSTQTLERILLRGTWLMIPHKRSLERVSEGITFWASTKSVKLSISHLLIDTSGIAWL